MSNLTKEKQLVIAKTWVNKDSRHSYLSGHSVSRGLEYILHLAKWQKPAENHWYKNLQIQWNENFT